MPEWNGRLNTPRSNGTLNSATPTSKRRLFSNPAPLGRDDREEKRTNTSSGGSSSGSKGARSGQCKDGLCSACGQMMELNRALNFDYVGSTGNIEQNVTKVSKGKGSVRHARDYLRLRSEMVAALSRSFNTPQTIKRLRRELEELMSKLEERLPKECPDVPCVDAEDKPSPATDKIEEAGPVTADGEIAPEGQEELPKGKGKGKQPAPPPPAKGKGKDSEAKRSLTFLRKMEWSQVAEDQLQESVFENLDVKECNLSRMVHIFGKQDDSKPKKKSGKWGKPCTSEVSLFDKKRTMQISIILHRRPLRNDVIDALKTMRLDADVFTEESSSAWLLAMPTTSELTVLRGYKGPLENLPKGERQLMLVAPMAAPTVAERMRIAAFLCELDRTSETIRRHMSKLNEAFKAVRASSTLRVALGKTRCLGNLLNHGDERGPVRGFSVNTLAKLRNVKSPRDPRINLLHIMLLEAAEEVHPQDFYKTFFAELAGLQEAAHICFREITGLVAQVRGEVNFVETCLQLLLDADSEASKEKLMACPDTDDCMGEECIEHPDGSPPTVPFPFPLDSAAGNFSAIAAKTSMVAFALDEELAATCAGAEEALKYYAETVSLGPEEKNNKSGV